MDVFMLLAHLLLVLINYDVIEKIAFQTKHMLEFGFWMGTPVILAYWSSPSQRKTLKTF